MSGWKKIRLGDNCEKIGSGATPKGGKDSYLASGQYSLIRSQNVLDFEMSCDGLAYINEEQAAKLNNVELHENDVLLNITGDSVARVCQMPKFLLPARVNQHVAIIRPLKSVIDATFLKYYLLNPTFKTFMLGLASCGGTRNALTKAMIEDFEIVAPEISKQKAIAEILSSLDDKIELNNQINANLEALAQAIFKQWFIDFEFPDENGNPYKSSGGKMVESESGVIPADWKSVTLAHIADITIGRTPPRKEHHWFSFNENDCKWVSIKDMGGCGVFILSSSEFLTREAVQKFKIPIIEAGTVIISFKLTVGRVAITAERMLSNEAIAHVRLKDQQLSPEFVYLFAKQFDYDSLGSTSSIATAVNSQSIKQMPIVIPKPSVLASFNALIKDMFDGILNTSRETNGLKSLRDSLLPRLVSGQISIE